MKWKESRERMREKKRKQKKEAKRECKRVGVGKRTKMKGRKQKKEEKRRGKVGEEKTKNSDKREMVEMYAKIRYANVKTEDNRHLQVTNEDDSMS